MSFLDLFRLKDKGYRVRYMDPRRRCLMAGLMLFILVLLGWQLYWFGGVTARAQAEADRQELEMLRARVANLEATNAGLLQRNALVERTGEIERQAADQIRETLRQTEARIQGLEEELSLYRAIVSPEKAKAGLLIQNLQVERGELTGQYTWRLVLAQVRAAGGASKTVEGTVDIKVEGHRNGAVVQLGLAELLPEGQGAVGFSFRYFQSLEGRLRIPEGFQPVSVSIKLNPKNAGLGPVEANFPWAPVAGRG